MKSLFSIVAFLTICLSMKANQQDYKGIEYVFKNSVQVVPCYHAKITYDKTSDAAELEKHYLMTADVINMPAGTKARLIEARLGNQGHTRYWVKASFEDGTTGYVPVIQMAKKTILHIGEEKVVHSDKGKLPKGDYEVVSCGPLFYALISEGGKTATIDALPYYLILSKGGRSYRVPYDGKTVNSDYTFHDPSPMYSCSFDDETTSVLDSLPLPPKWQKVWPRLRFKADTDLNRFCGLSVSEIRGILGAPSASVSLASSRFEDCCYDLFEEVLWKRGKQLYAKGIRVWYNKSMTVGYVEKYQTNSCVRDFKGNSAQLYLPLFPASSLDPAVKSIATDTHKGSFVKGHPDVKPTTNDSHNMHIIDRMRIGTMYFCENTFDTVNIFAIEGILIAVLLLINLLIALWIRFGPNYGSNSWLLWKCFLWSLPPTAVAVIYVFRWPLIIALIAAWILAAVGFVALVYYSARIDDMRCDKCHKWIKPLKIKSVPGDFIGDNYQKTWREELINHYYNGDSETRVYKAETTMRVQQEMTYTMKCPECRHVWEKKVTENRPSVKGPLLKLTVTTTTRRWKEITEKVTETRDSYTGVLLNTETDRSETSHSSTSTDTYEHYDVNRFQPFFDRYCAGDKKAIEEYYEKYWDSFC